MLIYSSIDGQWGMGCFEVSTDKLDSEYYLTQFPQFFKVETIIKFNRTIKVGSGITPNIKANLKKTHFAYHFHQVSSKLKIFNIYIRVHV